MNIKELKYVGAPAHRCPNKGITLIALIITIIVMLILVAVTINMAVNGGLFEKAGEAVGETENAVNKEQELSNGKIEIGGVLYDSIDDYINKIPSAVHNWTRTGDTFTCSHCNTTYEMGQVVIYTPAGKTSTTLSAEMSGLDKYYTANSNSYPTYANVDANGTQTIEQLENKWIVLGIEDTDGNGTYEMLLITTVVSVYLDELYFYGVAAYNNGPSEINRICEELYSNSEYGKARGITIEDVNRALNYTPLGGYYEDSEGVHTTGNLTTKLKDVPVFSSLKANGTKTPDGINTEEGLGNYELNGYSYNVHKTTLENGINDATSDISVMQRNAIFGGSEKNLYWLASRGICADSDYASFGLGEVIGGVVRWKDSLYSDGVENSVTSGLRPVVSLRFKLPEKSTEEIEWGEWNDR